MSPPKPGWNVVPGGIAFPSAGKTVAIHPASARSRLTRTSAEVVEEDTYLVLSTSPSAPIIDEHPVRVMTDVFAFTPPQLGQVITKGDGPYRFFAIVHDFDNDPSWTTDAIEEALGAVLTLSEEHRVRDLGLQMLGCIHGNLAPNRFLDILRATLSTNRIEHLAHIWLRDAGG
ncbi:MAG: hypothetical protein K0U93_30495 [Gammaproteobacteria bacterium]|nr:hypothetical protein [Gammaproteobacteria bacterium]